MLSVHLKDEWEEEKKKNKKKIDRKGTRRVKEAVRHGTVDHITIHGDSLEAEKINKPLRLRAGWRHDWYTPTRDEVYVREVVPGPFKHPRLVAHSPFVVVNTTSQSKAKRRNTEGGDIFSEIKDGRKCANLRTGIPDPWAEYLTFHAVNASRRRIHREEQEMWSEHIQLTESIWKTWGLYLGQGIPDPWRHWPKSSMWQGFGDQKNRRNRGKSFKAIEEKASSSEFPCVPTCQCSWVQRERVCKDKCQCSWSQPLERHTQRALNDTCPCPCSTREQNVTEEQLPCPCPCATKEKHVNKEKSPCPCPCATKEKHVNKEKSPCPCPCATKEKHVNKEKSPCPCPCATKEKHVNKEKSPCPCPCATKEKHVNKEKSPRPCPCATKDKHVNKEKSPCPCPCATKEKHVNKEKSPCPCTCATKEKHFKTEKSPCPIPCATREQNVNKEKPPCPSSCATREQNVNKEKSPCPCTCTTKEKHVNTEKSPCPCTCATKEKHVKTEKSPCCYPCATKEPVMKKESTPCPRPTKERVIRKEKTPCPCPGPHLVMKKETKRCKEPVMKKGKPPCPCPCSDQEPVLKGKKHPRPCLCPTKEPVMKKETPPCPKQKLSVKPLPRQEPKEKPENASCPCPCPKEEPIRKEENPPCPCPCRKKELKLKEKTPLCPCQYPKQEIKLNEETLPCPCPCPKQETKLNEENQPCSFPCSEQEPIQKKEEKSPCSCVFPCSKKEEQLVRRKHHCCLCRKTKGRHASSPCPAEGTQHTKRKPDWCSCFNFNAKQEESYSKEKALKEDQLPNIQETISPTECIEAESNRNICHCPCKMHSNEHPVSIAKVSTKARERRRERLNAEQLHNGQAKGSPQKVKDSPKRSFCDRICNRDKKLPVPRQRQRSKENSADCNCDSALSRWMDHVCSCNERASIERQRRIERFRCVGNTVTQNKQCWKRSSDRPGDVCSCVCHSARLSSTRFLICQLCTCQHSTPLRKQEYDLPLGYTCPHKPREVSVNCNCSGECKCSHKKSQPSKLTCNCSGVCKCPCKESQSPKPRSNCSDKRKCPHKQITSLKPICNCSDECKCPHKQSPSSKLTCNCSDECKCPHKQMKSLEHIRKCSDEFKHPHKQRQSSVSICNCSDKCKCPHKRTKNSTPTPACLDEYKNPCKQSQPLKLTCNCSDECKCPRERKNPSNCTCNCAYECQCSHKKSKPSKYTYDCPNKCKCPHKYAKSAMHSQKCLDYCTCIHKEINSFETSSNFNDDSKFLKENQTNTIYKSSHICKNSHSQSSKPLCVGKSLTEERTQPNSEDNTLSSLETPLERLTTTSIKLAQENKNHKSKCSNDLDRSNKRESRRVYITSEQDTWTKPGIAYTENELSDDAEREEKVTFESTANEMRGTPTKKVLRRQSTDSGIWGDVSSMSRGDVHEYPVTSNTFLKMTKNPQKQLHAPATDNPHAPASSNSNSDSDEVPTPQNAPFPLPEKSVSICRSRIRRGRKCRRTSETPFTDSGEHADLSSVSPSHRITTKRRRSKRTPASDSVDPCALQGTSENTKRNNYDGDSGSVTSSEAPASYVFQRNEGLLEEKNIDDKPKKQSKKSIVGKPKTVVKERFQNRLQKKKKGKGKPTLNIKSPVRRQLDIFEKGTNIVCDPKDQSTQGPLQLHSYPKEARATHTKNKEPTNTYVSSEYVNRKDEPNIPGSARAQTQCKLFSVLEERSESMKSRDSCKSSTQNARNSQILYSGIDEVVKRHPHQTMQHSSTISKQNLPSNTNEITNSDVTPLTLMEWTMLDDADDKLNNTVHKLNIRPLSDELYTEHEGKDASKNARHYQKHNTKTASNKKTYKPQMASDGTQTSRSSSPSENNDYNGIKYCKDPKFPAVTRPNRIYSAKAPPPVTPLHTTSIKRTPPKTTRQTSSNKRPPTRQGGDSLTGSEPSATPRRTRATRQQSSSTPRRKSPKKASCPTSECRTSSNKTTPSIPRRAPTNKSPPTTTPRNAATSETPPVTTTRHVSPPCPCRHTPTNKLPLPEAQRNDETTEPPPTATPRHAATSKPPPTATPRHAATSKPPLTTTPRRNPATGKTTPRHAPSTKTPTLSTPRRAPSTKTPHSATVNHTSTNGQPSSTSKSKRGKNKQVKRSPKAKPDSIISPGNDNLDYFSETTPVEWNSKPTQTPQRKANCCKCSVRDGISTKQTNTQTEDVFNDISGYGNIKEEDENIEYWSENDIDGTHFYADSEAVVITGLDYENNQLPVTVVSKKYNFDMSPIHNEEVETEFINIPNLEYEHLTSGTYIASSDVAFDTFNEARSRDKNFEDVSKQIVNPEYEEDEGNLRDTEDDYDEDNIDLNVDAYNESFELNENVPEVQDATPKRKTSQYTKLVPFSYEQPTIVDAHRKQEGIGLNQNEVISVSESNASLVIEQQSHESLYDAEGDDLYQHPDKYDLKNTSDSDELKSDSIQEVESVEEQELEDKCESVRPLANNINSPAYIEPDSTSKLKHFYVDPLELIRDESSKQLPIATIKPTNTIKSGNTFYIDPIKLITDDAENLCPCPPKVSIKICKKLPPVEKSAVNNLPKISGNNVAVRRCRRFVYTKSGNTSRLDDEDTSNQRTNSTSIKNVATKYIKERSKTDFRSYNVKDIEEISIDDLIEDIETLTKQRRSVVQTPMPPTATNTNVNPNEMTALDQSDRDFRTQLLDEDGDLHHQRGNTHRKPCDNIRSKRYVERNYDEKDTSKMKNGPDLPKECLNFKNDVNVEKPALTKASGLADILTEFTMPKTKSLREKPTPGPPEKSSLSNEHLDGSNVRGTTSSQVLIDGELPKRRVSFNSDQLIESLVYDPMSHDEDLSSHDEDYTDSKKIKRSIEPHFGSLSTEDERPQAPKGRRRAKRKRPANSVVEKDSLDGNHDSDTSNEELLHTTCYT